MSAGMRRVWFALLMGVCIGLMPSLVSYMRANSNSSNESVVRQVYRGSNEVASLYGRENVQAASRVQSLNKDIDVGNPAEPRKILLDCGANVASTVQLFRETYPKGHEYTIHSFEIDDRLAPYFKPYRNHHLHCPVGVAGKDGNMTAYSEAAWGPDKGLNNGKDMQWGGGSLFVSNREKADAKTGGIRKLSYRKLIPTIDLARWIKDTFTVDDYVILKLDVEGAEYDILRNMVDHGAFKYIDKFYGEYHDSQPTGWSHADKSKLREDIKNLGFTMIDWIGERRTYTDFEGIHTVKVPADTPGTAGQIYSNCHDNQVAVIVAVGMNLKRAHKVVATLVGYRLALPITLFLYGDFVEQHPEVVKAWAGHFQIGIREDGPSPPGHLELMPWEWLRMGLVSAILQLEELGVAAAYYLPSVQGQDSLDSKFTNTASARGLRVIRPTVEFPAKSGSGVLTFDSYYKYRDVERVPKALRKIHEELAKTKGGILSLDTDLPDTYMNSVFLMDYLVENSGFKLVYLPECIASSG
ncbi:uncharacterized protein LOC110988446 isoform X2 [Acanthaster planci]|uniref:Uncharacterized protein LOC110988446 isoform X2 n=1 Tax=Acanthaster planci TaxID=133434 RepID=A0A8B7ZPX0_ACAPL|nr:uncharacterized protein LOC110988446 isoform X2 [Acanthaster planci]